MHLTGLITPCPRFVPCRTAWTATPREFACNLYTPSGTASGCFPHRRSPLGTPRYKGRSRKIETVHVLKGQPSREIFNGRGGPEANSHQSFILLRARPRSRRLGFYATRWRVLPRVLGDLNYFSFRLLVFNTINVYVPATHDVSHSLSIILF